VTFEEARAAFPVLERVAYLNAGTNGPLAQGTTEAMVAQALLDLAEGRAGAGYHARARELRERVRGKLAALIRVPAENVALTTSTTNGAKTRLLALSHVSWVTGNLLPVAELQSETGLPLLVDGAQSGGAIEVDATPYDFYTVSGQKWPCGPDSTGALYVRDPESLRVSAPSYLAQDRFEPDGSFEPKPGAARFDHGYLGAMMLCGLEAALDAVPEWRFERAR